MVFGGRFWRWCLAVVVVVFGDGVLPVVMLLQYEPSQVIHTQMMIKIDVLIQLI